MSVTYTQYTLYITSTRVKTRKDHGPEGPISRPNICTQGALYRTRSGQMESARKAGAFAGERCADPNPITRPIEVRSAIF